MHIFLTSLQELTVYSCPEIDSVPEGGLPTSLSQLCISNCNKLMSCPMELGLHTLSCLRSLEIEGHKEQRLESFPVEWFLPSTLTHLRIDDFPNLKCLENKRLQHLTSLEISSFPSLKSLDDKELQHLTSLEISSFPSLKSLDDKELQHLTSLETLRIEAVKSSTTCQNRGCPPPFLVFVLLIVLC